MAEYKNAKTFVVAWIDWFEHNLQQQQVEALHEYHALELSDCNIFSNDEYHIYTNMQELKNEAFNRDAMFSVIEVDAST